MNAVLLAFAGGCLWGFTKLPVMGWWLGLALQRARPWRSLGLFALGDALISATWLLPSLVLMRPGDLYPWFLYLIGSLLLALPLTLGWWVIYVVARSIRAEAAGWALYFYALFPLGEYLGHFLAGKGLVQPLPWPELSHHPVFADYLAGAFPLLGSAGVAGLLACFFSLILLPFVSKEDPKTLLTLPLIPLAALLFATFAGGFPAPETTTKLKVAALPWSGALGRQPRAEQVLADLAKRLPLLAATMPDLLVLPETALPGFAAEGTSLETISARLLQPEQSMLLGVVEKHLAQDRFQYFNSALHLQPGPGVAFVTSQKETLVPFGERLPGWASALGLLLAQERDVLYDSGKNRGLTLKGERFFSGICLEQYLDSFYAPKETQAGFYVFLSRETDLSPLTKEALANLGLAKSLQTLKPVLKVANGAITGLVGASQKGQPPGIWISKALAGVYVIQPQPRISMFYRWGAWVTPLLLMGICGLCLGLAYRPHYGPSIVS